MKTTIKHEKNLIRVHPCSGGKTVNFRGQDFKGVSPDVFFGCDLYDFSQRGFSCANSASRLVLDKHIKAKKERLTSTGSAVLSFFPPAQKAISGLKKMVDASPDLLAEKNFPPLNLSRHR